ncbi:hypothetical protein ANO11243_000640 [Dothideomycetidae sp. 11243]|nr:hypothetical protein ANO11243_000640 [fungal sp. No.11243]
MTASATCTLSPVDALASPHSFTFASSSPFNSQHRQHSRSTGGGSRAQTPNYAENELEVSKRSLKRSLGARESLSKSMELARALQEADDTSNNPAQVTQSAWLKRLSTFSSNEGSISSSLRPQSAAFSQSNGSVAFSNTGSTAPIFPAFAPAPTPPNKLVKRSSSVRSIKGGTRIPLPTFKKPATSHERDANLQGLQRRPSTAASNLPFDSPNPEQSYSAWKTYFTPKISFQNPSNTSRRSSTSIPNPIKRVLPDRKYLPLLVSGGDNVRPASIDFDRVSTEDLLPRFSMQRNSISLRATKRFFSSPLPQRPSTASTSTTASISRLSRNDDLNPNKDLVKRDSHYSQNMIDFSASSPITSTTRSFSPNDVLPAPLPKWKRPSKLRANEAKNRRKGSRSSSANETVLSNSHVIDAEPPTKKRDISGSSRRGSIQSRDELVRSPKSPLSNGKVDHSESLQIRTLHAFAAGAGSDGYNHYQDTTTSQQGAAPALSSPLTDSQRSYYGRQSGTLSEFTSSFAGSDSDARYNDDDGFDSPNDTLFDSVRTRATSASSTGFKGPRIDTIFDENRVKISEHSYQPPSDNTFHSPKFLRDTFDRPRHSIIEEEESVSTPVRSQRNGSTKGSPETYRNASSPSHNMASSPPSTPTALRRKSSFEFGLGIDDKEDNWDFGDDEQSFQRPGSEFPPFETGRGHPNLSFGVSHDAVSSSPSKLMAGVQHDARSNIFDWSEQQHLDKSPAGRSPPRPRTVHGKKDAENRGSRAVGRRAPSGLHIRSQSVPVAPEVDGKRAQVVTNKFGTWGVGSKGVTEDWNEDFDFEEPVPTIPPVHQQDATPRHVSEGMQVPKAIQEQQINVLANIGLLRDWGLLIEELKELRGRAQGLHIRDEYSEAVWHEVDAMIDLADHESNDHTLDPRHSPPSSPTFDYSAFDEPIMAVPMRNSPRPVPKLHAENIFESPIPSPARKTFGTPENVSPRRPRKDSEAVARSVIEALQQRRNISDPTGTSSGQSSKKVPFDTATLRRIVPYVQELRDTVKRSIKEAEGLYNSPRLDQNGSPSFDRIFHEQFETPSSRRSGKLPNGPSERGLSDESASRSPPDELLRRMELMTIG